MCREKNGIPIYIASALSHLNLRVRYGIRAVGASPRTRPTASAVYLFSGFTVDSEPGARATGTPNHPALALGARNRPMDSRNFVSKHAKHVQRGGL